METISVITPTCGRESLWATTASLLPQLHAGDEWLLVADGDQPLARTIAIYARRATEARVLYVEARDPASRFGNAQRDLALRFAQASHLCFLDDDDIWNPGARDHFAKAADREPHTVHIFRARWGPGHHWHGILWKDKRLEQGNLGTPMVCIPHRPPLPKWMTWNRDGIVSDFGWLRAAIGDQPVRWHRPIVATVRPEARA